MTERTIHPLAWFWIYSVLRIVLWAALFGLLLLFGVPGFLAAVIALALSVPLSYVLLARPRAAMVGSLGSLRSARQARTAAFDAQVRADGDDVDGRSLG